MKEQVSNAMLPCGSCGTDATSGRVMEVLEVLYSHYLILLKYLCPISSYNIGGAGKL